MNRLFYLVAFVPSAFGQIIFPDETHMFISSTDAFRGTPVDSTEVNQNSQDSLQIPRVTTTMPVSGTSQDVSSSRLPEVNLTTISDLQPVPPMIPGSFSPAATTMIATPNPTQVSFSTAVSMSSGVDIDEELLLTSPTSTIVDREQEFSPTSSVQPSMTRITPTPTFVIRTSSDPIHSDAQGMTSFVQPSRTGTEVQSSVMDPLTTLPTSPPLTASFLPEDSDLTESFTSTEEVDNDLVITVMENEDSDFISEIDDVQTCMTPLGERGECTHLLRCSGYDVLRDKTESNIAVNFLRGRVCRILPRSLLFCCPDGDPIVPLNFKKK